jgi:hypothetical protein
MATTKYTGEVYFCETAADRENINCYKGQQCVMANGDIYICYVAGIWTKVGEEDNG